MICSHSGESFWGIARRELTAEESDSLRILTMLCYVDPDDLCWLLLPNLGPVGDERFRSYVSIPELIPVTFAPVSIKYCLPWALDAAPEQISIVNYFCYSSYIIDWLGLLALTIMNCLHSMDACWVIVDVLLLLLLLLLLRALELRIVGSITRSMATWS